jgi:hypothetical protein
MRSNIDVERDIKSAPYFDMNGNRILPGQILIIYEGEPFGGVVRIVDGELMFNETPFDDIFDATRNIAVLGWLQ